MFVWFQNSPGKVNICVCIRYSVNANQMMPRSLWLTICASILFSLYFSEYYPQPFIYLLYILYHKGHELGIFLQTTMIMVKDGSGQGAAFVAAVEYQPSGQTGQEPARGRHITVPAPRQGRGWSHLGQGHVAWVEGQLMS